MMDIEAIRRDFPVTKEYAHLDNAGLSPFPLPVVEAVNFMMNDRAQKGVNAFWEWVAVMDEAKQLIADLIKATPEEIAITQNTSEGINIVANGLPWKPGDNVVINDLEFAPNHWPWLRLRKLGVEVRTVQHREGHMTVDDFAALTDDKTRVIALSSVSYINGLRHDLEEIGALAKRHGAYLVVDAIQSVGVLDTDVHEGPVDFIASGGHKWLFSLLGSGFFFCRQDLIEQFEPVYVSHQSHVDRFGYEGQEYELSPTAHRFMHGNSNMAGVFALRAGIKYINSIGIKNIEARNRHLTDYLIDSLKARGYGFLSPLEDKHRSATINFVPSNPDGIVEAAAAENVIVVKRDKGIRVSPNFYNTEEEIDRFLEIVDRVEVAEPA